MVTRDQELQELQAKHQLELMTLQMRHMPIEALTIMREQFTLYVNEIDNMLAIREKDE